jgi:hypothetical protein
MSDGTHLSNFAGIKKEWPVYMTIGNLLSKMPQTPSTHSVVMVALLPIPIKNRNIPQKWLDEQWLLWDSKSKRRTKEKEPLNTE